LLNNPLRNITKLPIIPTANAGGQIKTAIMKKKGSSAAPILSQKSASK
jgi:hypothetical protein